MELDLVKMSRNSSANFIGLVSAIETDKSIA